MELLKSPKNSEKGREIASREESWIDRKFFNTVAGKGEKKESVLGGKKTKGSVLIPASTSAVTRPREKDPKLWPKRFVLLVPQTATDRDRRGKNQKAPDGRRSGERGQKKRSRCTATGSQTVTTRRKRQEKKTCRPLEGQGRRTKTLGSTTT